MNQRSSSERTAPERPVGESLQNRLFRALLFSALIPIMLLGFFIIDRRMYDPVLITLFILMAALSILLAWLTAGTFRRRIFHPLEGLHRSLRSLIPADVSDASVERSRDEIKQIAGQMEILVQFLVKQRQENRATLDELEKKQQELRDTNLRLEEAARLKSDFMANMSHELRTPMNAIIGYASLLLDGVYGPLDSRQENSLKRIMANARNLSGLINDILDLSKIDAGKLKLITEKFLLKDILNEVYRNSESLVLAKGLALELRIDDGLVMTSDSTRIRQMIAHLVDNAIKFTHEGSIVVEAKADEERDEIIISVADTGIGIEEENFARIFDEFHQVDSSNTREFGGLGLGLSLIRKLLYVLKGRIEVESKVGKGSVFTMHIPRTFKDTDMEMRPQQPVLQVPKARVKVLVVEDDAESVEILQESLKSTKYELHTLQSGGNVVEKAMEVQPFAILLDILMPEKDGWTVLQDLKSNVETHKIPIIIISIVDNKPLAFSLGVYDYIVKPVDRNILIDKLKKLEKAATRKILVVDDERDCLIIMEHILRHEGYDVILCQDGKAAVDMMKEHRPDLIFLDLMMPDVSGFDVVHEISNAPDLRKVPVIILTAKDLLGEEMKFLQGKVSGIVQKSGFNRETILDELATVLNGLDGGAK
jgi:signal transduction histidine kinase/CheY-like chemotaxis protein